MRPILSVRDLCVSFSSDEMTAQVVNGISFDLKQGETLGIVGESGCGKSVTSLSIMRLLPHPAAEITSGQILFNRENLLFADVKRMRQIRGNRIAMIFQEPMTALNPVHKVGKQIMEVFRLHRPELSKKDAEKEALEMMERVGISAAKQRMNEYPHQLSGGMRQRVMIAMALICKPDILIADEPTTALDVTIQAQILDLIADMQRDLGMSVIFITHDLGVIAEICDRVIVMYAGNIVEQATVEKIFEQPFHPYTTGLLQSIPKLDSTPKQRLRTISGSVPSHANMPQGCRFNNRCPNAIAECSAKPPILEELAKERLVACFNPTGTWC